MNEEFIINTEDELDSLFGEPHELVKEKSQSSLSLREHGGVYSPIIANFLSSISKEGQIYAGCSKALRRRANVRNDGLHCSIWDCHQGRQWAESVGFDLIHADDAARREMAARSPWRKRRYKISILRSEREWP